MGQAFLPDVKADKQSLPVIVLDEQEYRRCAQYAWHIRVLQEIPVMSGGIESQQGRSRKHDNHGQTPRHVYSTSGGPTYLIMSHVIPQNGEIQKP